MTVWLEIGGKKQRVELGGTLSGGVVDGVMECAVDGRAVVVDVRLLEPGVLSLLIADPDAQGRQYRCVLDGDGVVICNEGRPYPSGSADAFRRAFTIRHELGIEAFSLVDPVIEPPHHRARFAERCRRGRIVPPPD